MNPQVTAPSDTFDVIDVEVHSKSVRSIANEMAVTLMRTSGSPVVTEALDFSTCLLDRNGEQLAFSGFVTFHISTAIGGVRAVLSRTRIEDLRPGDGFLCNDPHSSGAIHQGDLGIVMPLFHEGKLVGFGYVNEHVLDSGGSAVSGFAAGALDNISEALSFNAVRVVRDYAIDPEWEAFIGNNVRMPRIVLNDIRSMIAANRAGERRLQSMLAEIGLDRFDALNEAAKDLSERAMRDLVSRIPDGTYDSEDWVEYDARGAKNFYDVRCRVVVEGDELLLQYRGAPQTDSFINGAWPAVVGQSWTTLISQLCYDIPINAGLWRPVTFDLGPTGTVVNSLPPAPVTQSHMETGMRINKILTDALSQACSLSPDPRLAARVAGQPCQSLAFFVAYGVDRRTKQPTIAYPVSLASGSGSGARSIGDGMDTYAAQCMCGCNIPDVEMEESAQPGFILWRSVRPNTSGPGRRRGGFGLTSAMAVIHCDVMNGGAFTSVAYLPARGTAGGFPGSAGNWELLTGTNVFTLLDDGRWPTRAALTGTRVETGAKEGALRLERGDVFHSTQGGGGGLGDPLLRTADDVAKDVGDGFVTVDVAAGVYGVVLTTDGTVDEASTDRTRSALRRTRIGREPNRAAPVPEHATALLVQAGTWRCGVCDAELGAATGNWREVAESRESPLHARLAEFGTTARDPGPEHAIVAREYFCPECASVLSLDVTFADRSMVGAARPGVIDPYPRHENA